jgi:hypothetical protein
MTMYVTFGDVDDRLKARLGALKQQQEEDQQHQRAEFESKAADEQKQKETALRNRYHETTMKQLDELRMSYTIKREQGEAHIAEEVENDKARQLADSERELIEGLRSKLAAKESHLREQAARIRNDHLLKIKGEHEIEMTKKVEILQRELDHERATALSLLRDQLKQSISLFGLPSLDSYSLADGNVLDMT